MFFNKNYNNLFLSKNSTFRTKNKINLILSPEFYWVREFEIPVKKRKDALKFVPNLFSEFLPNKKFEYFVVKKEHHKFLAFAYDSKEILNYIKQSNLEFSQIVNIYFAQTELDSLDSFNINNNSYIKTEDSIIIKMPYFFEHEQNLENYLSKHIVSKNKVNFQFHGTFFDSKHLYTLLTIVLLLTVFNFSKYIVYLKKSSEYTQKVDSVKKQYKLPSTSYETNSIMKKMRSKLLNDKKLRVAIKKVFDYKKHDNKVLFHSIYYDSKGFIIELENTNKSSVVSYFKPKFQNFSHSSLKGKIKVVLTYD